MPQVKTPRMTSEAKEHLGSSHNAKDKMPFSYMDKIILYVPVIVKQPLHVACFLTMVVTMYVHMYWDSKNNLH